MSSIDEEEKTNKDENILGEVRVEGKSKKFYTFKGIGHTNEYFMVFKPHLRSLTSKREENIHGTDDARMIANHAIMNYLMSKGIPTHLLGEKHKQLMYINGETGVRVKKTRVFPIEFICRYYAAGSIVRNYKSICTEGQQFNPPLYKFDLKQDINKYGVDDPPLFENYITGFNLMTQDELDRAKYLLEQIGEHMRVMLAKANMRLIDMKMEFGKDIYGNVILVDEITQDCIRANDTELDIPMTKDSFRNTNNSDEKVLNAYLEFNERILRVIG